jgi:hypothetical protein
MQNEEIMQSHALGGSQQSSVDLNTQLAAGWTFAAAMSHASGVDYRFVPVGARSYTPFQQSQFISNVNEKKSSVSLQTTGVCHGIMGLSYAYLCMRKGAEFYPMLKSIEEAKDLSSSKIEFLQQINEAQQFQGEDNFFGTALGGDTVLVQRTSVTKVDISYDEKQFAYSVSLFNAADQALQLAVKNLSANIGLVVKGDGKSHIIGITAFRKGDNVSFKIDDSNFYLDAIIDDSNNAKISLVNLMYFGYSGFFKETAEKKLGASVSLDVYQALGEIGKEDFTCPAKSDVDWAQKNMHRFFHGVKSVSAVEEVKQQAVTEVVKEVVVEEVVVVKAAA